MIRLHVNVDHVATVRNARGTFYPDPVLAAQECELAGADGITCHLREDRRHIRDDDLNRLRVAVRTLLNLEMAATAEMAAIAEQVKPTVVTLVPERREERTTEGGLDVVANQAAVEAVARRCVAAGVGLSVFIEAATEQIRAARGLGARQVELHTGRYCELEGTARAEELSRLRRGAEVASQLGLDVAAGHGLTRHNVVEVAAIPQVAELNIGHAVIADALFLGLSGAVRSFREAIDRGERLRRVG